MRLQQFHFKINITQASAGKSSLLIPGDDLAYFQRRCRQLGSRRAYFAWMVRHYLPHLDLWHSHLSRTCAPNWTIGYQHKGLDLQKCNFIPDAEDWEHFRNVAGVCGVSICFLFVFLMSLEARGFFENLPEKPPVGWNSLLPGRKFAKKFRKFSKFGRKMDQGTQTLHRYLQMR